MRIKLSFIGILLIIILIAFLDSPEDVYHGFTPDFSGDVSQATEEVNADGINEIVPTYSSLEYVLVSTRVEDGYMIEKYREYEIYEDENGVVVKREPTSNYEFIRYKTNGKN
ncbi:hypothetical protein [Oceanobacillus senegalensis]|uniref:hypothetical protein n=1 Tax=Oceanobacillus senegalensis TaxID=1936063 RepID=UPI000A3103F8|nr:hypothetical protein [Oceanobacillus senegalensis]